jgi:parallel beta-helix repeat protein
MMFSLKSRVISQHCSVMIVVVLLLQLVFAPIGEELLFEAEGEWGNENDGNGTVYYVDDDGAVTGNGSKEDPFKTISEALDEVENGDTIRVFNGTYIEQLEVVRSITIIGNGSDNTSIIGDRNNRIIRLNGGDIHLEGFFISNGTTAILVSSNKNIITRNFIAGRYVGISISSRDENMIHNNTFEGGTRANIEVLSGGRNRIRDNEIHAMGESGISVQNCIGTVLRNNSFEADTMKYGDDISGGIHVTKSFETTVQRNTMGSGGIQLDGTQLDHWVSNDIDSTNLLDGKPVICRKNMSNPSIPDDAGAVIIANCTDVLVEDQNMKNGASGVILSFCENTIIENVTTSDMEKFGVMIFDSDNVLIRNLTANNSLMDSIYVHSLPGVSNNIQILNSSLNGATSLELSNCENVTVAGSKLEGFGQIGMMITGTSDVTFDGNVITGRAVTGIQSTRNENLAFIGNRFQDMGPNQYSEYSIELSWLMCRDSTIEGNDFVNIGGTAISITDDFGSTITSNTMRNVEVREIALTNIQDVTIKNNSMDNHGIWFSPFYSTQIAEQDIDESNTVNGNPVRYYSNAHDFIVPQNAGQIIIADSRDGRIENQSFVNGSIPVLLVNSNNITIRDSAFEGSLEYGIRSISTHDSLIDNVTITGGVNGIAMANSNGIRVFHSTIQSNENIGIEQYNCEKNRFENNTISENGIGIRCQYTVKECQIHSNQIFNNTGFGVDTDFLSTGTIDATRNWWGSDTGPYHPNMNPTGTGDNVTHIKDNIEFNPWIGKNDSVLNVEQNQTYSSIQYAIDSAEDGQTLQVFSGVFYETIMVDRSVTIIGNGSWIPGDGGGRGEEGGGSSEVGRGDRGGEEGNEDEPPTTGTQIDGRGTSNEVFLIEADDVTISDLWINGSAPGGAGIRILGERCRIRNVSVTDNYYGISIHDADDAQMDDGKIFGNAEGIDISSSSGIIVRNCNVMKNSDLGLSTFAALDTEIIGCLIEENGNEGGIKLQNSDRVMITDNVLRNNGGGGIFIVISDNGEVRDNEFVDHVVCIYVDDSEGNTIIGNTMRNGSASGVIMGDAKGSFLSNNVIEEYTHGINIQSGCSNTEVKGNELLNNMIGIRIDRGEEAIVEGNDCHSNDIAIWLGRMIDGIVEGNIVHENDKGIVVDDGMGVIVIGNSVTENEMWGISILSGTGIEVLFNEIREGNGVGIQLNATDGVLILNNTISGNTIGVGAVEALDTEVHGNNIQDNEEYGIRNEAAIDNEPWDRKEINATYNYWGDMSGPYHSANNSAGTGDNVTDGVEFDPWFGEQRIWAIIDPSVQMQNLQGQEVRLQGKGLSHHSIIEEYRWTSSIDGELYSGISPFFVTDGLQNGTHVITLEVRDDLGSWSSPATTPLVVNGEPVIRSIDIPTFITLDETIMLQATVVDDNTISLYRWASSLDGLIYNWTNAMYEWEDASLGHHTISLRVMDDAGVWSEEFQVEFDVFTKPIATIDSASHSIVLFGENVTFTAGGSTDTQIERFIWHSNVDGELQNGTTANLTTNTLSLGDHVINLTIVDRNGLVSEPVSITVNVTERPTASIYSIKPNPVAGGDIVHFIGLGDDDGEILRYRWVSDLDGILYNDTNMQFSTHTLSYGMHTISLEVQDAFGIWSDPVTQFVGVTMKPMAFIDSVAPKKVFENGTVALTASGTDDGTISTYLWESDSTGVLYEGPDAQISLSNFSIGIHTIYLTVIDDYGMESDRVFTTLEVMSDQPPTIEILGPLNGETVSGLITLAGSSEDDAGVTRIEYRIPGSFEWRQVPVDTILWAIKWNSTEAENGDHSIELRAFDGKQYSIVRSVSVTVENAESTVGPDDPGEENDESTLTMILLIAIGMLVILGFLAIGSQRIKKTENTIPGTEEQGQPFGEKVELGKDSMDGEGDDTSPEVEDDAKKSDLEGKE